MHEEEKKSNLQQTTSDLSSSAAVTWAAAPHQQQTVLQVPGLFSPGVSSIVIPPTSNTQSTISQTNLRKRSQPSSQLSSSQKTKRRCTWIFNSLFLDEFLFLLFVVFNFPWYNISYNGTLLFLEVSSVCCSSF
jgi:hypothetical protein